MTTIVLVGAPGAGKLALVEEIGWGSYDDVYDRYPDEPAVGPLADYRIELDLAVSRALSMMRGREEVYQHSVITSVAHVTAKATEAANTGTELTQADWLAAMTIAQIAHDSWKEPDMTIWLPGYDEDLFGFNKNVSERMLETLEEMEIPYTTLTEENRADILKEINGING